ncbi:MAG: hypothetical protein RL367_1166 [Pseudomonadota bacterium]
MGNGKTAILVIHGMGSQRPLATLRGVVDALWLDGSDGAKDLWYTYPKSDDGSALDTPTIQTDDKNPGGIFEFHELYWAPIMARASTATVPLWLFELMRKGPGTLRNNILVAWHLGAFLVGAWLYSFSLIGLAIVSHYLGFPGDQSEAAGVAPLLVAAGVGSAVAGWRGLLSVLAAAVLFSLVGIGLAISGCSIANQTAVLTSFHWLAFTTDGRPGLWVALGFAVLFVIANVVAFKSVLGDAARYYRTSPVNISARRAVRSLAVKRLEALHKANYNRIIIVSHSLGSVIAYDMLRAYWAHARWSIKPPVGWPIFDVQNATTLKVDFTTWRNNGRDIISHCETARNCVGQPPGWLVTDFITLGSPLAHARFLQAEGSNKSELRKSFKKKIKEREFPRCPPHIVGDDMRLTFKWRDPENGGAEVNSLHQAALFGLTRWTNLYYPAKWLLFGDVVGGPLTQALLGKFICNVRLDDGPLFGHVKYWHNAPASAIKSLRKAVNLHDERA